MITSKSRITRLIKKCSVLSVDVAAAGMAHPFFWFNGHTQTIELQCVDVRTNYTERKPPKIQQFPHTRVALADDSPQTVYRTLNSYCECLQALLAEAESKKAEAA